MPLTQKITALALEAGFDLFGVASAEPFEGEREGEKGYIGARQT